MSTPNEGQAQDTLAAPTLAEVVQASRRRNPQDPAARRQQQGEEQSQITTRELNPFNTDKEQGGQKVERTIVQGEDDAQDAGGSLRKASSFLGKRLFGERFSSRVNEDGKQVEGDPGKDAEKTHDGKPKVKVAAAPKPAGDGKPVAEAEKPKVTIRQKPAISAEQIATLAANAAVETVARMQVEKTNDGGSREQKAAREEESEVEMLSEADKEDFAVMSKMAELYPDKYKDLPGRMINAVKERKTYAQKWEAEHAGKKIDWTDSEHSDFLAGVEPAYEPRHFQRAQSRIEAEAIVADSEKRRDAELAEIRRTAVVGNIKEKVREESTKAVKQFQTEVAPEADWDLTTDAGRAKAADEDPILGPVMARHAKNLEVLISEATQIYDSHGAIRLDPNKREHVVLQRIAEEYEDMFSNMQPQATANENGQTFVDRATWKKMSERERRNHWTLLRNEMLFFINLTVKKQAEIERDAEVEKIKGIAKKQGWRFDPESILTQKKKIRQNPDGIDDAGDRATAGEGRRAPAAAEDDPQPLGTETRTGSDGAGDDGGNASFAKDLVKRLFPRDTVAREK